ncbi:MAG: hypothetical protein KC506_00860, partial [Nanoarchaeota archaeon]|nr:hypothetical protein [Nanoarchaeota archaeon]
MKTKTDREMLIVIFLELFLILSFSPANLYSVGEAFGNERNIDFVFQIAKGVRNFVFDESTLVSAKTNQLTGSVKNNPTDFFKPGGDFFSSVLDDFSGGGVSTCTLSKDGKVCQEYTKKDCENACAGECLDGERSELPEGSACEVGLCFDESEGICQPRSTRDSCEELGGELIGEQDNEVRCEIGCCILGDQSLFVTETRCRLVSNNLGLVFGDSEGGNYFDGTIQDELFCLAQTELNSEKKGACVLEREDSNGCVFVSGGECSSITGNMDSFYPDMLCSNPDLETECLKQNSTACSEGKDEVYWFDSCGNRENIFEGDDESGRENSWNGGLIKPKEESCKIKIGSNSIGNQEDCGNCNRFLGSVCGPEDENQELDDTPDGGFVCRDLGCYDEQNVRRENGESWCEYQSKVGNSDLG